VAQPLVVEEHYARVRLSALAQYVAQEYTLVPALT
jgi:hypothetical protein